MGRKEVEVDNMKYKRVKSFKYLGMLIGDKNKRNTETMECTQAGKKEY